MKLIDFYNEYTARHIEIIPPVIEQSHDYLTNSGTAIYQFIQRHASVSIKEMSDTEWVTTLLSVISANSYKYDKLWETTQLEYDPLYNYDKTSTITTKRGQQTLTDSIASRSVSTEYGETLSTAINGATTSTTVNSETTDDSSTYRETDKNETQQGSVTNSNTTNTHTDTQISDNYTDTHTTTYGDDIQTERTIGNIGVVSSIDLLKQQRELVQFSFITVFMTDVLSVISNGYFE